MAAGGWSEAPEAAKVNKMPERYSGGRKAAEAHAKLFVTLALVYFEEELARPVLWASIKSWYHSEGAKAVLDHLREEAAVALAQSGTLEPALHLPDKLVQASRKRQFFKVRSQARPAQPLAAAEPTGGTRALPKRAPKALYRVRDAQQLLRRVRGRQPAFVPLPASEEPVVLPTSDRQATAANVAVVEGESTPGRTTGAEGASTPQPPRSPPPAVLAQVEPCSGCTQSAPRVFVHVLTVGETTFPGASATSQVKRSISKATLCCVHQCLPRSKRVVHFVSSVSERYLPRNWRLWRPPRQTHTWRGPSRSTSGIVGDGS